MRYILVLLIGILPLFAQTVSFSLDNDYVFDSDNRYTGGFQLGWMSDTYGTNITNPYVLFLDKTITSLIPVEKEEKYVNGSINLQEVIVTPNNTSVTEAIYDDVPYIGILAVNFSYFLWNTKTFEEYRISIGTVGSYSGAEEVQNIIHNIVGNGEAKGWKNQIGDYILLQVGYQKGIRQYEALLSEDTRFEWFNSYFVDVGNMYNGIGVGSTIRYGYNMPKNFTQSGSLLNGSQNDQLNLDVYPYKWGWSVSAGLFVDAVGYSYIMEESKELGYNVYERRLITRGEFGIDIYRENFRLSFELLPVSMTSNNLKTDSYGRLKFTWFLK